MSYITDQNQPQGWYPESVGSGGRNVVIVEFDPDTEAIQMSAAEILENFRAGKTVIAHTLEDTYDGHLELYMPLTGCYHITSNGNNNYIFVVTSPHYLDGGGAPFMAFEATSGDSNPVIYDYPY